MRAIPHNLHADTQQNKCRQPHEYRRSGGTQACQKAGGKAQAEKQDGTDTDYSKDHGAYAHDTGTSADKIEGSTNGDCGRNTAWSASNRERERVKGAGFYFFLRIVFHQLFMCIGIRVFGIDQLPGAGDNQQATANANNGQREPEKAQHHIAEQCGKRQHHKNVDGLYQ